MPALTPPSVTNTKIGGRATLVQKAVGIHLTVKKAHIWHGNHGTTANNEEMIEHTQVVQAHCDDAAAPQ